MPTLICEISQSLMDALEAHQRQTGDTMDHIVTMALADAMQLEHATLFQVSTTGALVEGVATGAVTVGELAEHGDFGLGTFSHFDGEMVVLDGKFYQVLSESTVTEAPKDALVPFAVVTHFTPESNDKLERFDSFDELSERLSALRPSDNLIYAVRLRGVFDHIKARTAAKIDGKATLAEVASTQEEFSFDNMPCTVVGFWMPDYTKAVNVQGWHLHFLSDDGLHGGHILNCRARSIEVELEHMSDFRMAIPETAEFLKADLTHDPSAVIEDVERDH
ncbi:MAG: acetolactate decarboxylase [Pseudomonadota bacterium]